MPYWDCPKCAAENALHTTSCWRCGYQYFPGYTDTADPGKSFENPGEPLRSQSREMMKEIKKGLADALDRSMASLDRIARKSSASEDPKKRR